MEEGSSSGKDSITNDRRHTTAVIDVTLGWRGRGVFSVAQIQTQRKIQIQTQHTNTNTNTNCLIEVSVVPSEAREMRQYLLLSWTNKFGY